MKYLFFDLECAKCLTDVAHIFSLGYVLTEDFEEYVQKDLLINPNLVKWDRYVIDNFLSYPMKEVTSSKKFNQQYESLKIFFENDNQIVFGYGLENDLKYLRQECDRYNLPHFNFKSVDVATLIKKLEKRKAYSLIVEYTNYYAKDKYIKELMRMINRQKIVDLSEDFFKDILGLDGRPHRSDVDAYLTMGILKKLISIHSETKVFRVIGDIISS